MFLKREELIDLTGYVRPRAQTKWLTTNGYKYEIAADGRPRVLKNVVEKKLGFFSMENLQRDKREPNFSHIKI